MGARTTKAKAVVEQASGGAELEHERVAVRAYEISLSDAGGDQLAHWLRAEEELRAELDTGGEPVQPEAPPTLHAVA
jgi:hypothetical protein